MRWDTLLSPESSPLVGRDTDLKAIVDGLTQGQDVALVAPRGMGKTTVALEALRQLAHSDWLTAMVPGAMAANVDDLAEFVAHQLDRASRRSGLEELEGVADEVAEGRRSAEQRLGLAIEGLVLAAERRQSRAALLVDDLDTLFASGSSAEPGLLLARKLRSVRQRSTALSVLYVMRSEATLRDVFMDPAAPLFGGAKVRHLEPLPAWACEELIKSRLARGRALLTEDALSRFVTRCRGVPLYLALSADAAAAGVDAAGTTVDWRTAESALSHAIHRCAPMMDERIDLIRRSHRSGLEVARRLAVGHSPYAGEKAPNNVTRALKNLERLGLAHQPKAREWALTDPFLEEVLRGFEPDAITARASAALGAHPSNLPAAESTVRHLRGNDVWGLRPHWFEPETVIRDSVYGEIKLTRLEAAILGTREFQRLRRMRQLGTVNLVYPGATHTRLEHSLGVLAASSGMLETMFQGERDWLLPRPPAETSLDWREALALGRIGGLVHDLATVPYGAAVEEELAPHLADYPTRLKAVWLAVVEELADAGLTDREANSLTEGRCARNLWQAIDGTPRGDDDYFFLRDLLTGPLSADSLDRVSRDRQALGLDLSSAGQLATAMRLLVPERGEGSERRLVVQGVDRVDVRGRLAEHFTLVTRHFEQVTGHRTTRAANAMVAAAVDHWFDFLREREKGGGKEAAAVAEQRLLRGSDDGFLDYLVDLSGSAAPGGGEGGSDQSLHALRNLVGRVTCRRLHRLVATAGGRGGVAGQIFDEFGESSRRRSLEQEAARVAGIGEPGRILLVVPRPPRPTFGDVLVGGEGDEVRSLCDRDDKLAVFVEKLDERLRRQWSVDVFADPDLPEKQRQLALDWLAAQLRVRWEWGPE